MSLWEPIVLIVIDFFEQKTLAGCKCYIHTIILVRIRYKLISELSMAHLDDTADHLANLVVKERLAF